MILDKLPKVNTKSAKRVGRGQSSGRGKTSGRGTKGQKARSKVSIYHPHFEGGQRPLFKRLPYRRGKGNSKISKKPLVVNLEAVNLIPKGQIVSVESLIKYNIVIEADAKKYGVKILGDGKLSSGYTFEVKTSKRAKDKITIAGGKLSTPNINSNKTENKSNKVAKDTSKLVKKDKTR